MYDIRDAKINIKPVSNFRKINKGFEFAFGSLEIIFIVIIWLLVFWQAENFAGMTWRQMLVYVLIANIVGMVSSKILNTLIEDGVGRQRMERLVKNPIKFLFKTIGKNIGINFFPLVVAIGVNLLALYFLLGEIPFDLRVENLLLLLIVATLSFVIEILLYFWARVFIFWSHEQAGWQRNITRLRKILAGAYFPLTIFPPAVYAISIYLPFAYTFYIPAEILQGKMAKAVIYYGIGVELIWIIILYLGLVMFWLIKKKNNL